MFSTLVLFAGISLIGYAFYKWTTKYYDHFAKRNMPYVKPTFLLGTLGALMLQLHHVDEFIKRIYNQYPTSKVVGLFQFRQPIYMIRDPELIKHVFVKDFDHFEDHAPFVDSTVDDLFGNSLFLMRGKKWRDMRATLSPAFTGSKMRLMFGMVEECAADMLSVLAKRAEKTPAINTDMKDLFGRYTTDVIATAAFGIKINSFADEENEFFVNSKRAMDFTSFWSKCRLMLINISKSLSRLFNVQFIDNKSAAFFRTMVLDMIQTRIEMKIYRPDMINLLMQLKVNNGKILDPEDNIADATASGNDSAGFATVEESHIGNKRPVQNNWSDKELAAQAFLFFAAGFDTSSTLLSFLTYELALNPEMQQKLYEECCETRDTSKDGRLTYEALQHMPYMDQVVSETLRMWPPVLLSDRVCVRDYEYDDGTLKFEVKKDTIMVIPILGLHRDPLYYEEPDKFRPERFSDECKGSIVPGAYLPFGVGPRNCIGSRFALMQVKAVAYHILLHFSIEPSADTVIPMRLGKTPGTMKPDKEIMLSMKKR